MKTNRIIPLLLLCLMAGAATAQTHVTLYTSSGATHNYTVESSGGIYFDNDGLQIIENLSDGASDTYSFAEVAKLTMSYDSDGIDDVEGSHPVLYPNPASSQITLSGVQDGTLVEIFDMMGRRIASKTFDGSPIDIQSIEQGIYAVRVEGRTIRFIKR